MTVFTIKKVKVGYAPVIWITTIWLMATAMPSIAAQAKIDRRALVDRHSPIIQKLDPNNPFTLGNGRFAFTADITGLQSFSDLYYAQGTPVETKARWAWHSRSNPKGFTLSDANQEYDAYGIQVSFPTNMDDEAGQWLRKNPHDLPLAKLSLLVADKPVQPSDMSNIKQKLNLWDGHLRSQYKLKGMPIEIESAVHGTRNMIGANIESSLVTNGDLSIDIQFPRGYLLNKKNTPNIDWLHDREHRTTLIRSNKNSAYFQRQVDSSSHTAVLSWQGSATLVKQGTHHYRLKTNASALKGLSVTLEFLADISPAHLPGHFEDASQSAREFWNRYWTEGAMISLNKSSNAMARELERRIILSQYILGAQAQANIPAQETGLTSSSWYGKHHTEMTWWHTAHWIYWNRPQQAQAVLDWYINRIPDAKDLAKSRGLAGARWAKMVGPQGQESPGGNPLIIWNQPQVIHLAELMYQRGHSAKGLQDYALLVEETAKALSSMLVWEPKQKRYSLLPPIWIAQEIYPATKSKNPSFELSYWRYGLSTAQAWRKRLGKTPNKLWDKQLKSLAALPTKDGKYVAIESIPDTFDKLSSRKDHPTMLAPWGLLQDPTVDVATMKNTLGAVLKTWDWNKKIWGWDYPMIAMTALKLGNTKLAFDLLLKDASHNQYLINGHCPQQGAQLPVYLPANGALLSAMAMIAMDWETNKTPGWDIQAEGF